MKIVNNMEYYLNRIVVNEIVYIISTDLRDIDDVNKKIKVPQP